MGCRKLKKDKKRDDKVMGKGLTKFAGLLGSI